MLGKLIKNEFKATARNFVPVYLVMLVVTLFLKIFLEISELFTISDTIMSVLAVLLITSFVVAIFGVIFGTLIFIVKRFYDNMLKDEGYLSFTLPVTTGQHIASKAITNYVWVLASAAVIVLSIVLLALGNPTFFQTVSKDINEGIKFLSDNGYWGYAVVVLAIILIGIYGVIMMIYTCLSVGQLFNKHRVAGAVITYVVIYAIEQICSSVFLATKLIGVDEWEMTMDYEKEFFVPMLIFQLIKAIVEVLAFTVITHVMLNRKLNLE